MINHKRGYYVFLEHRAEKLEKLRRPARFDCHPVLRTLSICLFESGRQAAKMIGHLMILLPLECF
jgi:hypothetical protein